MFCVETLSEAYYEETISRKKDRILQQIFDLYQPLIRKLCQKYRAIEEPEVIMQHIYLGIAVGLEKRVQGETVSKAIAKHVHREILDQVVRPFNRQKTSHGKDVVITDCPQENAGLYRDTREDVEETVIMHMDMERAINNLPSKERKVMQLWLSGFTAKEIRAYLRVTSSIHTSIFYYYFKKARALLALELPAYRHAFVC